MSSGVPRSARTLGQPATSRPHSAPVGERRSQDDTATAAAATAKPKKRTVGRAAHVPWWKRRQLAERQRKVTNQGDDDDDEAAVDDEGAAMTTDSTPGAGVVPGHGDAVTPMLLPAEPPAATLLLNPVVRCTDGTNVMKYRTMLDIIHENARSSSDDALMTPSWSQYADTPLLAPAPVALSPIAVGAAAAAPKMPPTRAFTIEGISSPNSLANTIKNAASMNDSKQRNTFTVAQAKPSSSESDDDGCLDAIELLPPSVLDTTNYVANLLDDYNSATQTFGWRQSDTAKKSFVERLLWTCGELCAVLKTRTLFPVLSPPVYVLGDIHGNFDDLAFFMKNILVLRDVSLTPCSVLCLGDYVDRGPHSLECCALLFELCLAATHEGKVTLLRGNHEDAVVCGDVTTYGDQSFIAECTSLLGLARGQAIFDAVTEVFRYLPLAAEIQVHALPSAVASTARRPASNASIATTIEEATGGSTQPRTVPAAAPAGPAQAASSGGRRHFHGESTANAAAAAKTAPRSRPFLHRILCTHGGIPRFTGKNPMTPNKLAMLRDPHFPRFATLFPNNPLSKLRRDRLGSDPLYAEAAAVDAAMEWSSPVLQMQWAAAFDLMWSDPTTHENDAELDENGFACNSRGGSVVSFSQRAVETFLKAHHFAMLFRAHQEKSHGLRLSKSNRVLTVFSSSNYLGHGNGAGCAVVSVNGEIQLIMKSST